MRFNIKLLGIASLMVLLPALSVADSHLENPAAVENELPAPSIKLEDILAGKYSGKEKGVKKQVEKTAKTEKSSEKEKKSFVVKRVETTTAVVKEDLPLKANVAKGRTGTVGWLYLGKLVGGKWEVGSGKNLGTPALPQIGGVYAVKAYSNVRASYPSKAGMSGVIKVLKLGSKVKVLAVHNSGNSGHYWAKVNWN